MINHQWLHLFHKELRQEAYTQGYRREETEHVVRHVSNFNEKGFVIASTLNQSNAREVVRREVSYFQKLGQEFEWKVYSYDQPVNLVDILKEEGFFIGNTEALMMMKLMEDHPLLHSKSAIEVKEITAQKGIKDIISLEEPIWQEDHNELGERLWRDKQNYPESLYLCGIYDEDRLVSAAWMYLEDSSSFASLWGGSTLLEYRGRGYYHALLSARAKKAYEKGYSFLTVDASPMSRKILEKQGFHCLAYTYECNSPVMEDC
ncbi:N-acetyltransferase [Virgibacillus halodenitrificans]|uniref:GNAT family N-acetyltransferase n=1 Tax=Virgibacillus halodenitrificans TaxID=1482 RepID=UPI0024BF6809|nr:GNAT family N-acetyltransferase [Virgibacillus halodenitrificans]WHX27930.1 N-acetyltransferase [Virgibacillus halodenitrificans]